LIILIKFVILSPPPPPPPPPQRKKLEMNVRKELNLRKKMDGMKTINNEFMKLLSLKKMKPQ
jgi:hypothetical protein